MRRLTILAAATAIAVSAAGGAFAGEKAKTTLKPLTVAKSTQAMTSLGLGGLGGGVGAGLLTLGIVATVVVVAASTSTTGT